MVAVPMAVRLGDRTECPMCAALEDEIRGVGTYADAYCNAGSVLWAFCAVHEVRWAVGFELRSLGIPDWTLSALEQFREVEPRIRDRSGTSERPDLPALSEETYLGDGLYASFDGFSIMLRAPREGGDHVVALEPAVYRRLREWIARYPRLKAHMGVMRGC